MDRGLSDVAAHLGGHLGAVVVTVVVHGAALALQEQRHAGDGTLGACGVAVHECSLLGARVLGLGLDVVGGLERGRIGAVGERVAVVAAPLLCRSLPLLLRLRLPSLGLRARRVTKRSAQLESVDDELENQARYRGGYRARPT